MMTTEPNNGAEAMKSNFTKTFLQMIAGGAFGFFAMIALDQLIGLDRIMEDMSGVSVVTMVMAFMFGMIGLIILVMSGNRKIFMLNQSSKNADAGDFEDMRPLLFWSAICIFLYSAILVLMALASNTVQGSQLTSFWAIVALMLGQTAISWHLWNRYDELYRDVTKQSCAVAFVIIEFALIIWAAAAICGLGVPFDPLAVIVAITGVYWTAAIWITVKRGMA